MGSAASILASKLGLVDSKKYFIDKNHFDILRSSWLDVEQAGAEKIGMEVFKGLFIECPETLIMFVSFADDPAWATSKHFRHHCKVFINVVGTGVKSFDKPDILKYHLEFLGSRHVGGGITVHHFDVLHNHFLRVLESFLTADTSLVQLTSEVNDTISSSPQQVIDSSLAQPSCPVNNKHAIIDKQMENRQQSEVNNNSSSSSSPSSNKQPVNKKKWSPQHKEAWSELFKAMSKVLLDHMGLLAVEK